MRKKVMIISETLMDGVGKHIVDVIRYIDHEKYKVYVLHSAVRVDHRFLEIQETFADSIEFYEVKDMIREIHPLKDLKAMSEIHFLMKRIKPDIVHCHSSKAGVLGRITAKLHGVKKIYYTPHAYAAQNQTLSSKKKGLYNTIEVVLARFFTTYTINVSDGEKAYAVLNHIHNDSHFKVIKNGLIDLDGSNTNDEPIENLKDFNHQIIIGTVARLYTQKNPFDFVEIASRIVKQREDVKFIWIGQGEQFDEVQLKINSLGLEDKIKLLGRKENVEKYYDRMDIFISTALYEGLPYTIIEAMRSACPIVASDVIGNQELVSNGVNGYLYNLGDLNQAVTSLKCLIDDIDLRKNMSQESRRIFLENYTIDKMMALYDELYRA